MNITRITRKPVVIPFTITLTDSNPATPTGVQIALLSLRDRPSSQTVWTDATYTAGAITVTVAGPDASSTDALVVPSPGADLWGKVSDASYVDAVRLESFRVDGATGTGANATASSRNIPAGGVDGQVLGIVGGQLTWVTVTTFPGTAGLS